MKATYYKSHTIKIKQDSHCASIYQCAELVKMIVGDIETDGTHNAIEKAFEWIDKNGKI
jgi:hypothetical protein